MFPHFDFLLLSSKKTNLQVFWEIVIQRCSASRKDYILRPCATSSICRNSKGLSWNVSLDQLPELIKSDQGFGNIVLYAVGIIYLIAADQNSDSSL